MSFARVLARDQGKNALQEKKKKKKKKRNHVLSLLPSRGERHLRALLSSFRAVRASLNLRPKKHSAGRRRRLPVAFKKNGRRVETGTQLDQKKESCRERNSNSDVDLGRRSRTGPLSRNGLCQRGKIGGRVCYSVRTPKET